MQEMTQVSLNPQNQDNRDFFAQKSQLYSQSAWLIQHKKTQELCKVTKLLNAEQD